MRRRYTALIGDAEATAEMFKSAKDLSEEYECVIYIMSNGTRGEVVHGEYVPEYKAEGYWIAAIFTHGYRVDL